MDEIQVIKHGFGFLLTFTGGIMVMEILDEIWDWNISYKSVYWSNNSGIEKIIHAIGTVFLGSIALILIGLIFYTLVLFISSLLLVIIGKG